MSNRSQMRMLSKCIRLCAASGLAAAITMGHTAAGKGEPFSDSQKKAIESIVKDYIAKHPEIVRDALMELERRQDAERQAQQTRAIARNAASLFRSKHDFVAGNPHGDVTIVEFFDYNCPYCGRAFNDLAKLIKSDDKVRVVLKELPILRKSSEEAAKLALASIAQGKYFEYHAALLTARGEKTKSKALQIAKKIGLDVGKLEKDMDDPKIEAALAENRTLANNIGLQGTPLYLIGDRIVPGAPEDLFEQLQANVKQVRKNGCRIAGC